MKNRYCSIVCLLLVILIVFSCCSMPNSNDSPSADNSLSQTLEEQPATEDQTAYTIYPPGTITVDGHYAVYNDGKITFRWNADEWYLMTNPKGFPDLYGPLENKCRIEFTVFDVKEGTVGDFSLFGLEAASNYFRKTPEELSDCFFAAELGGFAEKGWIGEKTGYRSYGNRFETEGEDTDALDFFSRIYLVSNGSVSCAFGIVASGSKEDLKVIDERSFEGNEDHHIMEGFVQDIIDSFKLL